MPKRVLVGVLNWGLGHASRSIPVILALQKKGIEPLLAGDGQALSLLKHNFPQLAHVELPSYGIRYGRSGQLITALMRQLPSILKAIRREQVLIQKLVKEQGIQGIISDNRYGLYHDQVPTAFICHQLSVIPPWGEQLLRKQLYNYHLSWINRFDYCWIPDFPGEHNLSGTLSHLYPLPPAARFAGPLSHFHQLPSKDPASQLPEGFHAELVAVLSGPEPQRSMLEAIIRKQAEHIDQSVLLVKGKPGDQYRFQPLERVNVVPYLLGADLRRVLAAASIVISRSGYSSLMDYATLGLKRVGLIPTPGQSEQLYLAQNAEELRIAPFMQQKHLVIKELIKRTQEYNGFVATPPGGYLNQVIEEFISRIN
ncbi:MAG: glycosyltransferase [Bacteroidota bacterium]